VLFFNFRFGLVVQQPTGVVDQWVTLSFAKTYFLTLVLNQNSV